MESRQTSEAKAARIEQGAKSAGAEQATSAKSTAGAETGASARFSANCLSTEEFVRFFHRFTGDNTLVLPPHPTLVVGQTVRFSLELAKKETPLLAGLCRPLETVPKIGRAGNGSSGVRVELIEIEPLRQALYDRVQAARRAHGARAESAYPAALERLARLLEPVISPAPSDSITDLASAEVLFSEEPTEINPDPPAPPPRENPLSTPRRATSSGFPPRLALPGGRTLSQEAAAIDEGGHLTPFGGATDQEITADHTALERPTIDLPGAGWPVGRSDVLVEPAPQPPPGQAHRNRTPVLAMPSRASANPTPVLPTPNERDGTPQPAPAVDGSGPAAAVWPRWLQARVVRKVGLASLIARLPQPAQHLVGRYGPLVAVSVVSFCLGLGMRQDPAPPAPVADQAAVPDKSTPATVATATEAKSPPPVADREPGEHAPDVAGGDTSSAAKSEFQPRKASPVAAKALLRVNTTPAGASLVIDKRKKVGRTPQAIEVRRGRFVHVTARKPGYHSVRKRIRVSQAEQTLELTLKKRR